MIWGLMKIDNHVNMTFWYNTYCYLEINNTYIGILFLYFFLSSKKKKWDHGKTIFIKGIYIYIFKCKGIIERKCFSCKCRNKFLLKFVINWKKQLLNPCLWKRYLKIWYFEFIAWLMLGAFDCSIRNNVHFEIFSFLAGKSLFLVF